MRLGPTPGLFGRIELNPIRTAKPVAHADTGQYATVGTVLLAVNT